MEREKVISFNFIETFHILEDSDLSHFEFFFSSLNNPDKHPPEMVFRLGSMDVFLSAKHDPTEVFRILSSLLMF